MAIGYVRQDSADKTITMYLDMDAQTAQSTWNDTWNEHGSNAIKLSKDGNRVFGMNSSGFVRYRTGVQPLYWGASVGAAAGTTDGVTATSLLAVNNYCIVGIGSIPFVVYHSRVSSAVVASLISAPN